MRARLAFLVAIGCLAGCVPNVAWLPDSSGFVYTGGKNLHALLHYDLAKGERRVLVADTGTATLWPALSADGKRIAVARWAREPGKPDTMQIIVYAVPDGKELHRSPPLEWKEGNPGDQARDERPTGVFWGPDDKSLLVHDLFDNKSQAGIYHLPTGRLRVLDGQPLVFGATPVRPDGKGFLLGRSRGPDSMDIFFVDWEGNEQPIAAPAEAVNEDLSGVLALPMLVSSAWNGNTAHLAFGSGRIRLDTDKRTQTVETIPAAQATIDGGKLQQQYTFPNGGATVRVLQFKNKEDQDKTTQRLEILRPGTAKPQVVVEKDEILSVMCPAPNGKLLAVSATKKNQRVIWVIDHRGQVVREITVSQ